MKSATATLTGAGIAAGILRSPGYLAEYAPPAKSSNQRRSGEPPYQSLPRLLGELEYRRPGDAPLDFKPAQVDLLLAPLTDETKQSYWNGARNMGSSVFSFTARSRLPWRRERASTKFSIRKSGRAGAPRKSRLRGTNPS